MNNEDFEAELIALLIILPIALLLTPLLTFGIGYIHGWITMKLIGNSVIKAINAIFNTDFTPSILPRLGGFLGWVGGFFTSTKIGGKKEK